MAGVLAGKTALVTGSTQGIGLSILRALAAAGCSQGASLLLVVVVPKERDTAAAPSLARIGG